MSDASCTPSPGQIWHPEGSSCDLQDEDPGGAHISSPLTLRTGSQAPWKSHPVASAQSPRAVRASGTCDLASHTLPLPGKSALSAYRLEALPCFLKAVCKGEPKLSFLVVHLHGEAAETDRVGC